MKTWTIAGPNDKEMNRLEAEVGVIYPNSVALRDSTCTWAGIKTFGIIKTDTLPDCIIDGVNSLNIKSSPIANPAFLFSNSAATENARRVTQIIANGVTPIPKPFDQIALNENYNADISIRFESSRYNGNNLIVTTRGDILGGTKGEVHWVNNTTSAHNAYGYDENPGSGNINKYYYNMGIGNITVRIYFTGPRGSVPPWAYVRLCPYPIIQGEPIRIYDADYNLTVNRTLTESDINNFYVG